MWCGCAAFGGGYDFQAFFGGCLFGFTRLGRRRRDHGRGFGVCRSGGDGRAFFISISVPIPISIAATIAVAAFPTLAAFPALTALTPLTAAAGRTIFDLVDVVVFFEEVGDVQEGVALEAEIDEGGLHSG